MTEEAERIAIQIPADLVLRIISLATGVSWVGTRRKALSDLISVCEDSTQAGLIFDLIERFNFVSGDLLESHLRGIASQIVDTWCLAPGDTCVVCKDIGGKADSSAALQQMLRSYFSIYEGWRSGANFRSNISSVIADTKISNIVLVDDFCGTGDSLQKFLGWIAGSVQKRSSRFPAIYAAFIGGMDAALTRHYPSLSGIYASMRCERGISDAYHSSLVDTMKASMISLEVRVGGISPKYSLGYEASEAIFCVRSFNPPNNVFPVFWANNTRGIIPLFPRLPK